MAFPWVDHVRKLDQCAIPELVSMIAGLRGVLGSSSYEDSAVIGLDGTESYWNVEVNVQNLSLLAFMVHVVERHDFLIEFEEMDFVGAYLVDCDVFLLGLRSVQHSDSSLREVVGHGELRVAVEANVVLVLSDLLVLFIV